VDVGESLAGLFGLHLFWTYGVVAGPRRWRAGVGFPRRNLGGGEVPCSFLGASIGRLCLGRAGHGWLLLFPSRMTFALSGSYRLRGGSRAVSPEFTDFLDERMLLRPLFGCGCAPPGAADICWADRQSALAWAFFCSLRFAGKFLPGIDREFSGSRRPGVNFTFGEDNELALVAAPGALVPAYPRSRRKIRCFPPLANAF
jgi:hypothetical protein